ncbi:MAG: class I SAM-dependent methyltransferase [Ktedonobacteraceae bacterium]
MVLGYLLETFIDKQHRQPSGIVGRIIGNRMEQQHEPENIWTVSLLSIQPTDTILEIGFGSGATIQRLAALASRGHVAGVDFSHTMVRVAHKRNAKAIKAGRIELGYGNVVDLSFEDSTFDKALSIHSLYFWPNPLKAFAEILRVLKPGGTVVITLLPKERWPGGGVGTADCRVYIGEDIARMMTAVGCSSTRIEPGQRELFREIAVVGTK